MPPRPIFEVRFTGDKLFLEKGKEERKTKWEKLSTNPLLLLLVGFFCTGVVGATISSMLTSSQAVRDRDMQRRQSLYDSREKALSEFTRLIYERRIRSGMLATALTNEFDEKELAQRKIAYDNIYVAWNANIQINQLLIRSALQSKSYTELESHIQYGLVPHLSTMHRCLTDAYLARKKGETGAKLTAKLEECGFNRSFDASLNCAYVITETVFTVVTAPDVYASQAQGSLPSEMAQVVKNRCEI